VELDCHIKRIESEIEGRRVHELQPKVELCEYEVGRVRELEERIAVLNK